VLAGLAGPAFAQQASITLSNCGAEYCYNHDNKWTIDKAVTGNTVTDGVGTVTWTVTATKDSSAAPTFSVHGGLTVKNTGSAPATIGNIVINLQKPNSPKKGSNAPYVSIAADVTDSTHGDAATSAKIVAGGSQENAATNAAWGTNNYTVSGAQGTFTETVGCSGKLEFKDASNNTVFSLVPQPVIPVGGEVTLLYDAEFNVACLPPAGTVMRVEAMVTFGNAGARGGSGATGSNIDIDGDVTIGDDEAKVRTVPCRVTLSALAAEPEETNASVTVTDSGVTATGTATTSNPVGFDQFPATVSATTSWQVSVDVDGGADGGSVCNAADLNGTADGGQLNVIVGYDPTKPIYDGLGNIIGYEPIYATYECAAAAEASDSACVAVGNVPHGFNDGDYCSYTKGGYAGPGAPGQLFNNNFLSVFLGGLTIGIEDNAGSKHDGSWAATSTGQSSLKTYLTSSASGPSTALTADTDNATSTSGGQLPRQTATLTLNVGFDQAGVSGGTDPANFGDLKLCNLVAGSAVGSWTLTAAQAAALNGIAMSQVLTDANNALGGNGLPAYVGSFGDLNQLATALNESFDNCNVSDFATTYLCK
jgi:hypothetical protein